MQSDSNTYTKFWFETFLDTISSDQTLKEVNFIQHFLSKEKFSKILDFPCGPGRHASQLLSLGYFVTGIDRDKDAIIGARKKSPNGTFRVLDMKELYKLDDKFDACICMWQSFGFFDSNTNRSILKQIYNLLNNNGRFILDIYNKRFFEQHQGNFESKRGNLIIKNSNFIKNNRLYTQINYGEGITQDKFDWEIFYEDEIIDLVNSMGLKLVASCASYEINKSPSEDIPRMQLVFEKF